MVVFLEWTTTQPQTSWKEAPEDDMSASSTLISLSIPAPVCSVGGSGAGRQGGPMTTGSHPSLLLPGMWRGLSFSIFYANIPNTASPAQWTWVWVDSGSWWWTGRPGVLRFMVLQRVRHSWVTELNLTQSRFAFLSPVDLSTPALGRSPGEGNGKQLQYSCLENSLGRETWRAGHKESDMTEHRRAHTPNPDKQNTVFLGRFLAFFSICNGGGPLCELLQLCYWVLRKRCLRLSSATHRHLLASRYRTCIVPVQ